MGNDKYTFVVEKKCPVCGETTRIVKTKSRIIVDHTDEDFCVHYQEFNPYYYRIWVCEHCGYAEDESHLKDCMTLLPLYLRAPQAERERAAKLAAQKKEEAHG